MSENPYAAPRTPVADEERTPGKPSIGARFLWAFVCAFPVFMLLVLAYVPREKWLVGALGSGIFAGFSGLIAMCIPVKPKAGFIIPAVLISLWCAYLIGTHSK